MAVENIGREWQHLSNFVTMKHRPKFSRNTHDKAQLDDSRDVTILVQGPIREDDNFTVASVEAYRSLFPNAPIVVSTWIGTSPRVIKALRFRGCEIVLNSLPEVPGPYNVNLQIISTATGLDRASKLGLPYVVKTRSDQRFHHHYSLSFMKRVLHLFPIDENCPHDQRRRILTISMGSFLYRLYGLTDMFQFGAIEDLLTFWSTPLDTRLEEEIEPRSVNTLRELALRRKGETYLMASFLDRTGFRTKWTLKDYWRAISERFVVVDASSLDLFWPKYSHLEDRWADYNHSPSLSQVDMPTWFSLCFGSLIADEEILDQPLREVGPVLSTENNPESW